MGKIKYTSGQIYLIFENDMIKDFYMRMLYRIDGEYLRAFSGLCIYKYEKEYVRSFYGKMLYRFDGKTFYDYAGRMLNFIRGEFITDFYGRFLYRIDGTLSNTELAFFLTLLHEGDIKG